MYIKIVNSTWMEVIFYSEMIVSSFTPALVSGLFYIKTISIHLGVYCLKDSMMRRDISIEIIYIYNAF
jgi:hypothetical protein